MSEEKSTPQELNDANSNPIAETEISNKEVDNAVEAIKEEAQQVAEKTNTQAENTDAPLESAMVEETAKSEEPVTEEKKVASAKISEDEEDDLEDDSDLEEDEDEDEDANDEEIAEVDYSGFSKNQLIDALSDLLENKPLQKLKKPVGDIRDAFNDIFNEEKAAAKEAFMAEEGANEIDFYFESPAKKKFNTLYGDYRKRQKAHFNKKQEEQNHNLVLREGLVEDLKALFENDKTIRNNYNAFRAIQDRWNEIGHIPRDKYNIVWNNYKHLRDTFYSELDLDRETREIDQAYNLDKKLKIVVRAQELGKMDNVLNAHRELQMLHKVWKEDTGPVSREYSDKIWDEFTAASQIVQDRRQELRDEEEKKYEANYDVKKELNTKIEAVTQQGAKSHKEWQNAMNEVQKLRDAFFAAGRVPKSKDKAVWNEFKDVTRDFNKAKNDFYKGQKDEQYDNLDKKKALVKIAEENKDNEDIQGTLNLMKRIQSDWKKIGHVPRKDSDKIWKQFKGACNHFFERINAKKNEASREEEANLEQKQAVLDGLKDVKLAGDHKTDIATIKEKINAWKVIGRVPYKSKDIESKFNKAIDGLFNQLDLDKKEAELIKFENKVNSLLAQDDSRAMQNEEFFLTKKIEEVRNEKLQLQNNLEFFKHVKDDNPLVKDVHKNIAKHEEELHIWKAKLTKIRTLRKKAEAAAQEAANPTEDTVENADDNVAQE